MEHPHEPVDAIKGWQDWYKKHRIVAQMDEPLVTKDSRENMHDTTDAVDSAAKVMWMSKAQEHFADTLAEYQYELSGKDLYKAFYKAAYENAEAARKEYEKSKELLDMLRYNNLTQD
jgi:hypothetical protein